MTHRNVRAQRTEKDRERQRESEREREREREAEREGGRDLEREVTERESISCIRINLTTHNGLVNLDLNLFYLSIAVINIGPKSRTYVGATC